MTIKTSPSMRPMRPLLFAAFAFFVLAMPSLAQMPGTLYGLVLDQNEEPVADVELTLTDPESASFKQTETSDAKGKYTLFIANATKAYTLTITKAGYQPVTLNGVKVSARQRTRRNFNVKTAAAASAAAATSTSGRESGSGVMGLYNRGVAAMNADDLDSAQEMFDQALESQADFRNANAALARLHLRRKNYEAAVKNALLAAEANLDVDAMNQVLYSSYSELGQKDKASAILAKMETADPEKASANLFNKAADLYNNGDTVGAKPLLEQVLALDADHPKANYMMGLIYAGELVNDKARMHLEKFISLAPNDPDAPLAKEMLQYLQ